MRLSNAAMLNLSIGICLLVLRLLLVRPLSRLSVMVIRAGGGKENIIIFIDLDEPVRFQVLRALD